MQKFQRIRYVFELTLVMHKVGPYIFSNSVTYLFGYKLIPIETMCALLVSFSLSPLCPQFHTSRTFCRLKYSCTSSRSSERGTCVGLQASVGGSMKLATWSHFGALISNNSVGPTAIYPSWCLHKLMGIYMGG